MYEVSKTNVGRVTESVDYPLEYCENLVGFSPSSWVEYVVWFEEVYAAVEDAEKDIIKPKVESKYDIFKLTNEK